MPNIYDVTTETLRQDVIEAIIRHTKPTADEIADYLGLSVQNRRGRVFGL